MASRISEENILNQFARILSTCLFNAVQRKFIQYDIASDQYKFRFEFKNTECFGKVLNHSIDASEFNRNSFSQLEDIAIDLLRTSIENLPRADRLERERLWNLNNKKENLNQERKCQN